MGKTPRKNLRQDFKKFSPKFFFEEEK